MTAKEGVLNAYDNWNSLNARNSMGCSEDWYCSYYAISRTFPREEVEKMDEVTVALLVRLADSIADALY